MRFIFRISGVGWLWYRWPFTSHLPAIQTVTNHIQTILQLYHKKVQHENVSVGPRALYCHSDSAFLSISSPDFVCNVWCFCKMLLQRHISTHNSVWGFFDTNFFLHGLFFCCCYFATVWLNLACVFFHVCSVFTKLIAFLGLLCLLHVFISQVFLFDVCACVIFNGIHLFSVCLPIENWEKYIYFCVCVCVFF